MNDSFLQDLDLVPRNEKPPDTSQSNTRHVTTRKVLTTTANNLSKHDNLESKHDKIISSSSKNLSKVEIIKHHRESSELRKLSNSELKPLSSTPKSDKKKPVDENDKPIKSEITKDKNKAKLCYTRLPNKVLQDNKRTSASFGYISKCQEVSVKENTRPSNDTSMLRDSSTQFDLKKGIVSDSSRKSNISGNIDSAMLLSNIKELVSRYTEQETLKVLREMQNLHINSQANLIKQFMSQTNEIINELSINKNSENVKSLIEENERMREEIFILRARNEILFKKINEMTLIKEENMSLKLKLKELQS